MWKNILLGGFILLAAVIALPLLGPVFETIARATQAAGTGFFTAVVAFLIRLFPLIAIVGSLVVGVFLWHSLREAIS